MTAATILAGTGHPVTDGTAMMINVANGALHMVCSGVGSRVIMLHGWTLDHRMWQPQAPLNNDFELIMPDRRGFGRSTAPPGLNLEAEDLAILANDGPVAVVGLSQGAAVALDFAKRYPELVTALVLAGTPLPGLVSQDTDPVPLARFAHMVANGRIVDMKAEWRLHKLTQVNVSARPLLEAMLDDYVGRDLEPGHTQLQIGTDTIAKLDVPILALAGTHDTDWRRTVALTIAEIAPKGSFAEIEAAGHLCNLDNAARFNAVVQSFLTSTLH